MKTKKLLLTFLSIACVAFAGVGLASCGEKTAPDNSDILPSESLNYKKIDGKEEYQVIGLGTVSDLVVIIPSTYNDLPVTSIGNSAFNNCNMTEIIIPNSVTSMGIATFYGCKNLTKISIPDSVSQIEAFAFSYCTNLTEVVIPDSITSIEYSAFLNCSNLTEIVIPDSVKTIGASAFQNCSNLARITLPFIGETAHEDLNNYFGYIFGASNYFENDDYIPTTLKKVTITSARHIENYAFCNCYITEIIFPENLVRIGAYAFSSCLELTSVTISNNVKNIEKYAFLYCTNLTIYCEAESQPDGWDKDWNYFNCPVVWGYKTTQGVA